MMQNSKWPTDWLGWQELGQPIVLKSESLAVLVLPQVGGSVAGLRFFDGGNQSGEPVFRTVTPADVCRLGARGASQFTMLPFANRAFDNVVGSGTARYAVTRNTGEPWAIHGVGWQLPWDVSAQDNGLCELKLDVRDGMFAFPFSVCQRISVFGNTLEIAVSLQNTGPKPVPVGVGFHPYFALAPRTRVMLSAEDAAVVHPDALPNGYTGCRMNNMSLPLEPGQPTKCYLGWSGQAVIEQADFGYVATMLTSATLTNLTVYVPSSGDCFALEPQSHATGVTGLFAPAPQLKPLLLIAPGEVFTASMAIIVRGLS